MSSFDEPPAAPADHRDSFHWHYAAFDDNYRISRQSLFFFVAVFALLLVLFVFALYLRWVCRLRAERGPHAPPHAAAETQLGLQAAVIDSYPIVLHAAGSGGDAECCICLSGFQEGEKVKVLPACRHRFHAVCVDKWLRTHSSCPLCRVSLRFDSAV